MTSVLGFLFCKMLVIFLGRWPEPCISLSSPLTLLLSPPSRHTHLSSSHRPAIQTWDEVTHPPQPPHLLADMVWRKESGYDILEVWKYQMLPITLLFFLTHFVLFPCPKPLGKASSSPHPAVVVPLPSISYGGFQVAAAFAQSREFPKCVTLATRNFSPAKTTTTHTATPMCETLSFHLSFSSEKKNTEWGWWCLPSWRLFQWNRLLPGYLHILIFLATPL